MSQPEEKYCNGCGAKIQYDAKFCNKCGFEQIRIAVQLEPPILNRNNVNSISNEKGLETVQDEKPKSNYTLLFAVLGLSFICCIGGYLYYKSEKSENASLASRIDSVVAIDTISSNTSIVTLDTGSSNTIVEENSSLDTDSINEDNIGTKLINEFFQININGNYEQLDNIFAERVDFHKLNNVPVDEVKSDFINFKRKWTVLSETLISLELVQQKENLSYYKFERERQLNRIPDNGNVYKYIITGEMIIDNEKSKIVSFRDTKTTKVD